MKKHITSYQMIRYIGVPLEARREIPYEMKLTARLILDDLCFRWNKERLSSLIDQAIDERDLDSFKQLSEAYKEYL